MAVSYYQALQDMASALDTYNGDTAVMDVVTPLLTTAKSTERKNLEILEAILDNATLTASVETAIAEWLRPTAATEAAALATYTASRTESGRQDSIIAALEGDLPPFIKIESTVFTFVDKVLASCGPAEIPMGATLATTLDNINTVLNASTVAAVAAATYTDNNVSVLTITNDTAGTGGNSFAIKASAGSFGTVSAATLTGGAAAVAATGTVTFADNPTGSAAATGTITFADNPTADVDSITLNGIAWTFTTGASGTTNTQVKGSLALTLTELASNLNASVDAALTGATYSEDGTILTVTYDTVGTAGNAYTLVASADTVSGATLTGGAAADTITLNSVAWSFTTAASGTTNTQVKGSLSLTLDELVSNLNASVDASLTPATYSKTGTTILTITYDTTGTGGNAYTLAASADTVSAATLTNGAAAVAATGTITFSANPTPGEL